MNGHASMALRMSLLAALSLPTMSALAQHTGHEGHDMPVPTSPATKPTAKKRASPPAPPATTTPPVTPAPVDHAAMGHGAAEVDHAAMGHGTPAARDHAAIGHEPEAGTPAVEHDASGHSEGDHASMGHGETKHAGMDHGAMNHGAMGHGKTDHAGMDHSDMDHAAMGHTPPQDLPADAPPRTPIPALTDADRAAAFPPALQGHEVHDQRAHSYWLMDRFEWQDTDEGSLGWEGVAWIGGDIHRLWLRTEGEASDGEVESGSAEVLYGRAVSPWWDAVAGVRHDFGHGPSRTYAAFGVQGLAPYKFEVEATAFIGGSGRGGATLEAEYDTLITNRLILQWVGEANLHFKDDPAVGAGSGLSTIEAGARLRYEFSRRFAPYIGVEWERAFGETADLRRGDGEPINDTRLVAGIRFWF